MAFFLHNRNKLLTVYLFPIRRNKGATLKYSKLKLGIVALSFLCVGCVIDPYYDEPPARPVYGYYGYGPAYPDRVNIDINNGWGHGGYYGHGGGGRWR